MQTALLATMRSTARWRRAKAAEFADDPVARRRSYRAMVAIQVAARTVEKLPSDDHDLDWLRHVDMAYNQVRLCEEARDLLSRFGMDRGAWTSGPPDERQVRNLLRRMAGAEARERAAQRRDSA